MTDPTLTQDFAQDFAQDFDRVLIANRGEIAVRIMRTCAAMGLQTVAVFSEADADMPHVRAADLAICIGPAAATESYLCIDKIIAAAQASGAQAIHPGYGFLSENAEFVDAVAAAGLIFIGPTADSVRQMGSKARARELMSARGVPVVPGYGGDDQSDARLIAEAQAIGFPVLVKAAAGGGGKGMSIVRDAADLAEAIAQARRLATSAFGDATLVIERYLQSPRHIEVQILGDGRGRVVHCFERECSIQRRFQKIVEETPAPGLPDATRKALCDAGVKAGEALDYRGAGTVEFILDAEGRFYFLEVNTRLQVEHPITEAICGIDLVAWQIRIARGEALMAQSEIQRCGHAIECRLYAEDPANGFLPGTGTLAFFDAGDASGRTAVRVDSGVETGSVIGVHYDPMLAKLIVHGAHRADALRKMRAALRRLRVVGVTTNQAFLAAVVTHPAFVSGAIDTHFIPTHLSDWQPAYDASRTQRHAIVATRALLNETGRLPGIRSGFRNNRGLWQRREWRLADDTGLVVEYRDAGASGLHLRIDETDLMLSQWANRDGEASCRIDDRFATYRWLRVGDTVHVFGPDGTSQLTAVPRFPVIATDDAAGGLVAPMPGRVVSVGVAVGDAVTKGQTLVVLEAMKMEQSLTAPADGVIAEVRCAAGDLVDAGMALIVLEGEPTAE